MCHKVNEAKCHKVFDYMHENTRPNRARQFAQDTKNDTQTKYIKTDIPVDTVSSGNPVYLEQTGLQQGWVNWNYKVVA